MAAFFNIRPTRRSNPEARTTLDALHTYHISQIKDKSNHINDLKAEIASIRQKKGDCQNPIELTAIEEQEAELNKNINNIESNVEMYDYFLNTGEILYNYYDIQDKIQRGIDPAPKRISAKAKPGSIMAALEEAAKTDDAYVAPVHVPQEKRGEELRRDKLLEEYLQRIDPEHARGSHEIEFETFGDCPHCDTEMIFSANEAVFTCCKCGYQDFVLIDSDKPSYKDPPREISYYAYKRINHFNEWLAQFQAKESTEIPQEVYDAILVELKKERIMDFRTLKASKVKEILKKLKFNKYYEHIPHIINRLNGQTGAVMSREIEEKLRYMFKEIQPSFQAHCPKDRNNFLSYSYVLYKFCELLELDEYLPCFTLLKNRDKLYVQDKIWQKICQDLRWQFVRSI
uniref:Viral late gene transcription factor 3 zinc ribbon domain-containing protein n=1 Tax=viral metagenome TaxID=1070528 RepID=A0A6C0K069_9ZZZZ